MKTLKVYGGSGFRHDARNTNRHHQTREIVAAASKTAALRLMRPFGVRAGHMCETFNETEIPLAMSKPGTVFWAPCTSSGKREFYESEATP